MNANATNQSLPVRLIRLPEVMHRVGLCRTSIYMRIAAGRFPAPKKIGRAAVWSENDIINWIKNVLASDQ